jgi:hypothetical protein
VLNGQETDVDCGGPNCSACLVGANCQSGSNCETKSCENGTCQQATCSDNIQNGNETGTDCGGPKCSSCPAGQECQSDTDCQSGVCDGGTCQSPTCQDGVQNQQETDVDCGGPNCSACPATKNCKSDGDCQSGVCDGGTCQAPTCKDGVQNQKETDVDCGGPNCSACPASKNCKNDSDCQSDVCKGGTCRAPTCKDGVQNQKETDVDCGGPNCSACAVGKSCQSNSDCQTKRCTGGTCGPAILKGDTSAKKSAASWTDGTYAESCQAYRYPKSKNYEYKGTSNSVTGDGWYRIKPYNNQKAFVVYCDQTTDGGGWTAIGPDGTNRSFNDQISKINGTTCKFFNGSNPGSTDRTGETQCRYDIDLGFAIDDIRVENIYIKSNTDATSDMSYVDQPWGEPSCNDNNTGDWWFGTPKHNRAVISVGRQTTPYNNCGSGKVGRSDGFSVSSARSSTSRDTTLRMEWGENGGQYEAFIWTRGRVFVRDSGSLP